MGNNQLEGELKKIISSYIEDFLVKKKDPALNNVIVEESIPVVWFGDIDKYRKSKVKIVTVALNPSFNEFFEINKQTNEKTVVNRFEIVDFQKGITDESVLSLKDTLCKYFIYNPYVSWFKRPEVALNALGASYYEKPDYENTAIHIDACTAIATDPTWGKLNKNIKSKLKNSELFNILLNDYLKPDIVLFSAARPYFEEAFKEYTNKLEGEKYEKESEGNTSTFYVRKYKKDNRCLFWIYNVRGTAFGCSYSFMQESISELMK